MNMTIEGKPFQDLVPDADNIFQQLEPGQKFALQPIGYLRVEKVPNTDNTFKPSIQPFSSPSPTNASASRPTKI
jgi:hypothetical protein